MKRLLFAAAALLCLAGNLRREWVYHGVTFPDQIIVLVDKSGSMAYRTGDGKTSKYAVACREAKKITEHMSDQGRLLFAAFGDDYVEYPGGWITLPDAENLAMGLAWIKSLEPESGGEGTNFTPAMQKILGKEEGPLGVIVLTDAQVNGDYSSVATYIAGLNKTRKEPAIIGIVGILTDDASDRLALTLCTDAGGSYVRISVKEKEEEVKK